MKTETGLRADARRCFDAALQAVEPGPLARVALLRADLPARVHVAAIGKAAEGMMRGALAALGDAVASGLVIAPRRPGEEGSWPGNVQFMSARHPVPDASSVEAGRAMRAFAQSASDAFVLLLSGGASSLATLPFDDIALEDLARTTALLLRAGASIDELNAVRKHLDRIKGGRLAVATSARVIGLAISDVIGDDPGVIGSGPISPDESTYADALDVLRARGVIDQVPASVRTHLERGARGEKSETPKPGDAAFDRVSYGVIAGNRTAVAAAAACAESLGYRAIIMDEPVTGEAREAGRMLALRARELEPGAALIAGGETVVTVRGPGIGGRCQELALAGAIELERTGIVLFAASTDGIDGPTHAAGAICSGTTAARARAAGLDAHAMLDANDSHAFFSALRDLYVCGPTGTNVADLCIVLT